MPNPSPPSSQVPSSSPTKSVAPTAPIPRLGFLRRAPPEEAGHAPQELLGKLRMLRRESTLEGKHYQEQGKLEHSTRQSGCGARNLNRLTGSWVMVISHGRGYCLLASRQSSFPDVIFEIGRERYWSFHFRTKLRTRAILPQSKESWSWSGKFNEGWIHTTSCPVNLISIYTTTPP